MPAVGFKHTTQDRFPQNPHPRYNSPMQEYTLIDLIAPWLALTSIALLIMYAERWIHQHTFGIGYLLTKDKIAATRLFYVFFLPGILVHEVVQYLVAGALNVPIKKVVAWPEKQENGTMRLDFIVIEHNQTDWLRASLVAASPFMVMAGIIWYISTHILDLHMLRDSLGGGDLRLIWAAIEALFQKSDFVLWLYLLFVVANSMIPQKGDARGLPLIGLMLLGLVLAMIIVGMDAVLIQTLGGPVTEALIEINYALLTILILNIGGIFLLGLIEDTLEYWRGFKMDYSGGEEITKPLRKPKREPGSDEPLEVGDPLPSIYNMDLPLPDPDKLPRPSRPRPAVAARETTSQDDAARPFGQRPTEQGERPFGARPAPQQDDAARPFGQRPAEQGERPFGARPAPQQDDAAQATQPARPFGQRPTEQGERPFGARPAPQQDDAAQATRPAAPTGAFRPPQPSAPRPRADFEAERARLFGASRPADDIDDDDEDDDDIIYEDFDDINGLDDEEDLGIEPEDE